MKELGQEDYRFQEVTAELAEAFSRFDKRALESLSEDGLDAQFAARNALSDHFDLIRQAAKRAGHRPGDNPEVWNSVAAMRDLASDLLQTIDLVRYKKRHP